VYDAPAPARGTVRWTLFQLPSGKEVMGGHRMVTLRPGQSVRQKTLDLARWLGNCGSDEHVLRIALDVGDARVSEDSVFLAPPRFVQLPAPRTERRVDLLSPRSAQLTFTSAVFQHRFAFELAGLAHLASDNYFELYPGEARTITVEFTEPVTAGQIESALSWRSLADTY
jgi:beta-mannosidase